MWHVPLPKIEPRAYGKEAEDDAKIKDGEMKRLKAKGREVRDAAWEADDNNHHLYVWSSQQLANLFRIAGYEVLDKKVLADSHLGRRLEVGGRRSGRTGTRRQRSSRGGRRR